MNRIYNIQSKDFKLSPEKLAYQRDYYQKHKDKYREYSKKRQALARKNPELKAKMVASSLLSSRNARKSVVDHYGGKCACCGESNYEFLAIDHVNGGGTRLRREKIQSSRNYYKIKKEGYPDTYRILCHNCNQSLGLYGYCPHDRNFK